MPSLPTSLALTSIADGSLIVAADHRNNYSAIQTAVNSLITSLGAGATGQFLSGNGTTLSWLQPPGTTLNYTEVTSGTLLITATTAATATAVVTAAAITFDGATAADIDFFVPLARPDVTVAARTIVFELYQDGSDIGILGQLTVPSVGTLDSPIRLTRRMTPVSGSRTYSVRSWVTAGTGTIIASTGGAASYLAGFIRITKA